METDKLVSADEAREFAANGCGDDDTYRLADTVIALREIIEGRTVAPSPQEIAAHAATGGRWLIAHDHDGERLTYTLDAGIDDARIEALCTRHGGVRWWALDVNGPCAWPVVTP